MLLIIIIIILQLIFVKIKYSLLTHLHELQRRVCRQPTIPSIHQQNETQHTSQQQQNLLLFFSLLKQLNIYHIHLIKIIYQVDKITIVGKTYPLANLMLWINSVEFKHRNRIIFKKITPSTTTNDHISFTMAIQP